MGLAYYADLLFSNATICMDDNYSNSPLSSKGDDLTTLKLKSKASEIAEELAKKIIKNAKSEKDNKKDLRGFFLPKPKPGSGFSRMIDDEFNKFKEALDQEVLNSKEYKEKGKLYFLAWFAFYYNRYILIEASTNERQKLLSFTNRSYDASVVYDIIQFLNSDEDMDYGYLSGICEALDVNGYANANNVGALRQIIKDIESGIKNNGGEFKFSDFVRTLQCVAPITTSEEFDKCILEFLQSNAMKDKPINSGDLTNLLIAKSYILNHMYYKNNEHKIGGNSIGDKALEHAKNSVEIRNIKFGENLAEEIRLRLEKSNVERLSLAAYAAIASSSYFADNQSELFDKFKPYILFDVAEVLVLSEMKIDIPDAKKASFVQQIIDFMDKKADKDGEYIISFDAAVKILGSLNLEELDEKSGLSEKQKLDLLKHMDIDKSTYGTDFMRLLKILKPSSEAEQNAILEKLEDNKLWPSDVETYVETVKFDNITDDIKNKLIEKYCCLEDLSNYESLKYLDLKGEQIDNLLKKISENKPCYPFSLHVLINALPNASEQQKLKLLDFEEKHKTEKYVPKYKSNISEAIECAKAFKFKEKQSKIKFLNALDKFIYYGIDVLDAEKILALAKALDLDFGKDKDNDLKNELLRTISRYIKVASDKESDEKAFAKYPKH